MKDHERRGQTRVPYVSELECENGGTRVFARTHDVSTSGIFIHSLVVWEPGSQLKLTFQVGTTRIETVGEVCYSLPQIGMGVRFLDLKPEYGAAIGRLVESRLEKGKGKDGTRDRTIVSGVEPVDALLGGLDCGNIYLAHGDASGKSLFGIQFLIEGLRTGQNCALVIPYSPQDAARRFARLGYDCQGNLDSGSLVIIRYPKDPAELVREASELTPVLPDLESMLGDTSLARLVFDPVTNLLAGNKDKLKTRVRAFTAWVRTFGAAVVLTANGNDADVVENLVPLVKESFRFDVKEDCNRIIRLLAFEKSPTIPDQPIRVDPSRGIFLLAPQDSRRSGEPENTATAPAVSTVDPLEVDHLLPGEPGAPPASEPNIPFTPSERTPSDELSAMLDELRDFASCLVLDIIAAEEEQHAPAEQTTEPGPGFQLPSDVFAFAEQVRKEDAFRVHGEEAITDAIDAAADSKQSVQAANDEMQEAEPLAFPEAPRPQTAEPPFRAQDQDNDEEPVPLEQTSGVDGQSDSPEDESQPYDENASLGSDADHFKSYGEFVARIFTRIEDGLNNNRCGPFSIVSCRLPRMTADGGRVALQLFDLVNSLVSAPDAITTNKKNDLVILLENADSVDAAEFAARLRKLVSREMGQEPSITLWSLPGPEETPVPAGSPDPIPAGAIPAQNVETDRARDRAQG